MSQEDIEWFKSTFRPIPKPELPDDCIDYSIHYIPSSPAPAVVDEAAETRTKLTEVHKSSAELTKQLLKDYIWQRDPFRLEITKNDGTLTHRFATASGIYPHILTPRYHDTKRADKLWRLGRG